MEPAAMRDRKKKSNEDGVSRSLSSEFVGGFEVKTVSVVVVVSSSLRVDELVDVFVVDELIVLLELVVVSVVSDWSVPVGGLVGESVDVCME